MRILEIRFPTIFSRIGRPQPIKTAESDSTNAGLLLFLLSNEHKLMADARLTETIYKLRFCCIVELLAAAALASCLVLAPSAKDVIKLGCWLT